MGDDVICDRKFRPFYLKEGEILSNGVGTLEVLYNDGFVRVTTDTKQKNTYVHVIEPFGELLLSDRGKKYRRRSNLFI